MQRLAGHCWRSKDELARDIILWQPHHGKGKRGRPSKTYNVYVVHRSNNHHYRRHEAYNDRRDENSDGG